MSFVIRSAGGQRSLTRINSNKNQERTTLRDDLIEAFRGLVIKFEVRIADIVPVDAPQSDKQQEPQQQQQQPNQQPQQQQEEKPEPIKDTTSFNIKKENIISDLKTKLVVGDPEPTVENGPTFNGFAKPQIVPKVEPSAPKIDRSANPPLPQTNSSRIYQRVPESQTTFKPSTNGFGHEEAKPTASVAQAPVAPAPEPAAEKPKPKATDFVPYSLMKPASVRPVSNIVPVIRRDATPQAPSQPIVEKPQASYVEADLAPVTLPPPSKVEVPEPRIAPKSVAVPEAPKAKAAPKQAELVTGTLKIGTAIETCVVGFGGTDEEPIYYIPYDTDKFIHVSQQISDMAADIEAQPLVNSIDVGDIVFAKSHDDNSWCRSIVKKVNVENVLVFHFDWGLEETLVMERIRRMSKIELGLSSNPAFGVKIDITNKPGPLVERFVDGEKLNVSVDSYDKESDTYCVTILEDQ